MTVILENGQRTAATRLTKLFGEKCNSLLLQLENYPGHKLGAQDCMDLWSNLGELKFDPLAREVAQQSQELERTTENLETRLRKQLQSSHGEMVSCFEVGMSSIIGKIRGSIASAGIFAKGSETGLSPVGIEIDHDLLNRRDKLEYSLMLAKYLDLKPSPKLLRDIPELDESLGKVLAAVLPQLQEARDNPTPYPNRFPPSFWWRQTAKPD